MDTDTQRERYARYLKLGIGFVGAVLIAPVVFLAVKGIVGLFLAFVVGQLCIQFAPVVSLKIANWKMKALVAEVEANPIETMQTLYVEKNSELLKADENIADFETEIRNFDDQIDTFKSQYPQEAGSYVELSEKMHDALKDMKSEQTEARKVLADFSQKIKKAQAIYKMSLAAQKVVKLSRSAEAQVFAQIKEQVAFDAVRTQLNKSFSQLNLAIERRHDTKSHLLTAPATGEVIDVTPRQKALVER